MQIVGGGPDAPRATLIVLEADQKSLSVVVQNLTGKELAKRVISAKRF